jgi:hypothetical protein
MLARDIGRQSLTEGGFELLIGGDAVGDRLRHLLRLARGNVIVLPDLAGQIGPDRRRTRPGQPALQPGTDQRAQSLTADPRGAEALRQLFGTGEHRRIRLAVGCITSGAVSRSLM